MTAPGPDVASTAGRPAPRRPGRPRSAAADAAILTATLEQLSQVGYGGLSVEAVAASAGVGKATVYRRWRSKDSLVVDALARLDEPVEPPASGSVRDELVALVEAVWRRSSSSLAGRILPRLLAEASEHPDLMRRYREQVILPRRERMAGAIGRGMAEGSLREDLDVELTIDLLVTPVLHRAFLRHCDGPPASGFSAAVVDQLLTGLRPRPG